MNIHVLTSSRADYGIYKPLLLKVEQDPFFDLTIVAFGTHLSEDFGLTIKHIEEDGFQKINRIQTKVSGDQPIDISNEMSNTIKAFSNYWNNHEISLILCLGDRFEMCAAVLSAIPFNIPIAHIHGGEITKGAIDNTFRDMISSAAKIHFTAADQFSNRVNQIKGSKRNIHTVGSISMDDLDNFSFYTKKEFNKKFDIDLSRKSILVTVHPETVNFHKNKENVEVLISALQEINDFQIIITMPNADTEGLIIRKKLLEFARVNEHVFCKESFGKKGYFTCLKHVSFLCGNTSSGIIEAASFGQHVINLGERQKGRLQSGNVINVPFNRLEILEAIHKLSNIDPYDGVNVYKTIDNSADKIIEILKAS